MSMSSREREGPVGGVGGSLFTGEAVLGVLGDDRLRPLNRRPSLPPRPLDALLKESTCAQRRSLLRRFIRNDLCRAQHSQCRTLIQQRQAPILPLGACSPEGFVGCTA